MKERLGLTFSQVQCGYLGIPVKESFQNICRLKPDILRLCTYWDEIDEKGFKTTDYLIATANELGIPTVLTVGVKSPRYKEFWLPERVEKRLKSSWKVFGNEGWQIDETLVHCGRVVERYRDIPTLQYFQVENEPLNKLWVTHGRALSSKLLKAEVGLVRELKRPTQGIVLTNSIDHTNPFSLFDWVGFYKSMTFSPDAVGVNFYDKIALSKSVYLKRNFLYRRKARFWSKQLKAKGIEPWGTEIQAEPWEAERLVCINSRRYPSSSPEQAEKLMQEVKEDGYTTRVWWGREYWEWCRRQGYNEWEEMWERTRLAA